MPIPIANASALQRASRQLGARGGSVHNLKAAQFFGAAERDVAADEAKVDSARVALVQASRALQLASARKKPADALVSALSSLESDNKSAAASSSLAALAALYGTFAADDAAQLAAAKEVAARAAADEKAAREVTDAAQKVLDGYGASLDAKRARLRMMKIGAVVIAVGIGGAWLYRSGRLAGVEARIRSAVGSRPAVPAV